MSVMSSNRKAVRQRSSQLRGSHLLDEAQDRISCPIKRERSIRNRYTNAPLYGSSIFQELAKAAESGCRECSVLVAGLAQYEREIGPLDRSKLLTWRHGDWEMSVTHHSGECRSLEIFAMPGTDTPFSTMPDGVPLPENTASARSIENARAWLNACSKNHEWCRVPNPLFVPRRLVHVSKSSVEYNVAIMEPKHIPESYICLSHCWGVGDMGWKLTKGNADFGAGKISLTWGNLSKTIRHALEYTVAIGQKYIWIDSLCIIQDDEEDWSRESGKMAEVFENAFLTICAAASDSSTKGCFSTPQISYQGCMFQYSVKSTTYNSHIREQIPHWKFWNGSLDVIRRFGYPAFTRGWIYQERVLSTRLLYFGVNEISWECNSTSVCVCQPHDDKKNSNRFPKVKHHRAILSLDEHELAHRWRTIVKEFSPLDLTFEKDKLPAVSGIAKQMQRVRQDDYLAGLWRNTLVADLAWFRQTNTSNVNVFPRPQQWRAPTWSWASVNGYVTSWVYHYFYEFASVHEVRCQPKGADSTGEMTDGYIVISGRTIEGNLEKKVVENTFTRSQLEVFVDSKRATWDLWPDYDFTCEGPHHVPISSALKLLLLTGHRDRTFCLVLRKSRLQPDAYERVALAAFGTELTIFDDFPKPMLREFEDAKEETLKII